MTDPTATSPGEETPGGTGSSQTKAGSLLARLTPLASGTSQTVRQLSGDQEQRGKDRSWIARSIIVMFCIAIGAVLFILLVQGIASGDWTKVATEATDPVKSAVLPIVTLVLGYYFGQSDKS